VTKTSAEFSRFQKLTSQVLSVPHAEIKAKLEAEKKEKKKKRRAESLKERVL
jgi:hypothetical protein